MDALVRTLAEVRGDGCWQVLASVGERWRVFCCGKTHLGARQGREHFEAKDVRVVIDGAAQIGHS